MLTADERQLRAAVSVPALIDSQREAFVAASAGRARVPPVGVIGLPAGSVHVKAGYLLGADQFAVKVVSAFPAPGAGPGSSDGFIALCSANSGRLEALLVDGGWITDARTAAAGVVATQALAAPCAASLAVLGVGVQAALQARAVAGVRQLEQIVVWGRDAGRTARFVQALAQDLPAVQVRAVSSPREAVAAAAIVLTATSSCDPILSGAWLRPGQHVTAIGADERGRAELDAAVFTRADRLIVDSVSQNLALGDICRSVEDGDLDPDQIDGELGQVLSGGVPGRVSADDVTVVKLTGLGIQDLTAAVAAIELLSAATSPETLAEGLSC